MFTKQGTGPRPQPGDVMVIHGIGRFTDGKEFWNTRTDGVPYGYTPGVDRVINGFEEGMREVREGDRIVITMKPELGYGERGNRDIPPNATLVFDYEILSVEPLSVARLVRAGDRGRQRRGRARARPRPLRTSASTTSACRAAGARQRRQSPAGRRRREGAGVRRDAAARRARAASGSGAAQAQRGAVADAIRSYETALRLNPKQTAAERRDAEAATKSLADLRTRY